MQLMTPTPMNALRQARSASPSSERRTPGTAVINPDLFTRGMHTSLNSPSVVPFATYRFLQRTSIEVAVNLNAIRGLSAWHARRTNERSPATTAAPVLYREGYIGAVF